MKIIDYKLNPKTNKHDFCIKSGEAWKIIPTRFNYDWLKENELAFLEIDDNFATYNYIKGMKQRGFKLTKKAQERMKELSVYFQRKFDLYVMIAKLNANKKQVMRGSEL